MRRAIAAVPDGTYCATLMADGFDDAVTRLACAVTVRGDTMHIDYAGTSQQIDRGINCVMNYTHAYSVYPIKCSLDPFTPRNEGTYRAITVAAPERSILNPQFPAPVGARQLTGHLLAGVIYQALAEVIPDRVIAECGGAPSMRAVFSGIDRNGDRFNQILFATGGMGASPHRDGLSTTSFPTNVGTGSIEAFESVSPLVVWHKRLRPDSGGAGRFRGGLGQEAEIEVRSPAPAQLSLLSDRRDHPALGLLGGGNGAPALIVLADGSRPHPKSRTTVSSGTRLRMVYPGGGGYGDPRKRAAAAVEDDLRDGYVTTEGVRRHYRSGRT
jgi:N-methylhydantoinase B